MEEDLLRFIRQRGVDEKSIKKMREDKFDKYVILAADDSTLSNYLPVSGDRVAVKNFCARGGSANKKGNDRKNTILNTLRKKLQLKRHVPGNGEGNSESDESDNNGASPAKRNYRQGNKFAKRTTRKIEIGWLMFDTASQSYRQVRGKTGGGTRKVDIGKNSNSDDILYLAKQLFFPNGSSSLGSSGDFLFELRDFSQEKYESTETVGEMYTRTGMNMLRYYLTTIKHGDPDQACGKNTEQIDPGCSKTPDLQESERSIEYHSAAVTVNKQSTETVESKPYKTHSGSLPELNTSFLNGVFDSSEDEVFFNYSLIPNENNRNTYDVSTLRTTGHLSPRANPQTSGNVLSSFSVHSTSRPTVHQVVSPKTAENMPPKIVPQTTNKQALKAVSQRTAHNLTPSTTVPRTDDLLLSLDNQTTDTLNLYIGAQTRDSPVYNITRQTPITTDISIPNVTAHLADTMVPIFTGHTTNTVIPGAAAHVTDTLIPRVAAHVTDTVIPRVAAHTTETVISSFAPPSRDTVIPSVAAHTTDTVISSFAPPSRDTVIPSVAAHTTDTVISSFAPPSRDTVIPSVAAHTTDTVISSFAPPSRDTAIPSVAAHTTETVISSFAPPSRDTVIPSVAAHTTDTVISSFAPPSRDTVIPSVAAHTTDTVISSFAPPSRDTVIPSVAAHTTDTVISSFAPPSRDTVIPSVAAHTTDTVISSFAPPSRDTVIPSVAAHTTDTVIPSIVAHTTDTVISSFAPPSRDTVIPSVAAHTTDTVIPSIVANTTDTVISSFAPPSRDTVIPSVAAHTTDTVISSFAPPSRDTVIPSVAAHTTDTVIPSIVAHTTDTVIPSIVAHTTDTVIPSVVAHTTDTVIPSVAAHTTDTVIPSIVAHTTDTVVSSIVAHTTDTVVSSIVAHTTDTVVSSIVAHTTDTVIPSVAAHITDAVISSFEITIHRGPMAFHEMLSYFKDPDITNKLLTVIRILPNGEREQGEDTGGILRDLLTDFWSDFYSKCTVGRDVKVPSLRHDFGPEEWQSIARVLMYGWENAGYWPVQLSYAFLCHCICGEVVNADKLMADYFCYVAHQDKEVFQAALENFDQVDNDDLLDAVDSHDCRTNVNKDNLKPVLLEMAHKEMLQMPMFVTSCWRNIFAREIISSGRLANIYASLSVTNKKVVNMLQFPEAIPASESDVAKSLKKYVRELDLSKLKRFLRYCTGSDLITVPKIKVEFSEMTGFSRRPIAHTCGCVLMLAKKYENFMEFRSEFDSVLESNIWVMDIV